MEEIYINSINIKKDKATICFMGDMHIGSKFFNRKKLKQEIDYCVKNKIPVLLLGDQLECATRDSIGAGIYEQEEIIEKQIESFYSLMEPLRKKKLLLGIHKGNHESRVFITSGVDLTKMMARHLDIPYFHIGQVHNLKLKKQNYYIYTTHGSGNGTISENKIKSIIKQKNVVDVDLYVQGHTHHPNYDTKQNYVPNGDKIEIIKKYFANCGAYLNYWGSYGHEKGYEPLKQGAIFVEFDGKNRDIKITTP